MCIQRPYLDARIHSELLLEVRLGADQAQRAVPTLPQAAAEAGAEVRRQQALLHLHTRAGKGRGGEQCSTMEIGAAAGRQAPLHLQVWEAKGSPSYTSLLLVSTHRAVRAMNLTWKCKCTSPTQS